VRERAELPAVAVPARDPLARLVWPAPAPAVDDGEARGRRGRIVRPVSARSEMSAPARLLAAHRQAKEKRNPPSPHVWACTSLSNPVFSNDLSVQALAFDLAA
jgi:hypothetical protein